MFDRFTSQACTAIVLSRQSAHELGHHTIDSCDLVFGLIATSNAVAARVLTELGLSATALREHSVRGPQLSGSPASRIPFAAESRTVLDNALREALALGHISLTTGHLLLGVIVTPECAAARMLAALGVDDAAVRTAVLGLHSLAADGEMVATLDRSAAALAQVRLGQLPSLPGWRSLLSGFLLTLTWYAATGALITAASWKGAGPELIVSLLVVVPVMAGAVGMVAKGRAIRRLHVAAPGRATLPEHLRTLLAGRGIRSVEVLVQVGPAIHDRCLRFGRRAWIVLAANTLQSEQPLRFVLGHEVAHLLRNDTLRRRVGVALYSGLLLTALLSADLAALLITFGSALVHSVVACWSAELSSDAVATRWSGIEAFHAWTAEHQALLRESQNRTISKRLRGLTALLTCPPLRLRLAVHPRPR